MIISKRSILITLVGIVLILTGCKSGQIRLAVDQPSKTEASTEQNIQGIPDLPVDCNAGQKKPCGSDKGECSKGTISCVDNKWGECVGAVGPKEEVCDGKDNNCNGTTDEGCECEDGQSRDCAAEKDGIGVCKKGTQLCEYGKWAMCKGMVRPDQEYCDGKDNDCDGSADEELTRSCNRGCEDGMEICEAGNWINCNARTSSPEEICDGLIDENCDGAIDEGCACTDGDTRSCGPDTDFGRCAYGTQLCSLGQWGECEDEVMPLDAEECNGIDDDCDNLIDEDLEPDNAEKFVGLCAGQQKLCALKEDGTYGWIEPDYRSIPGYVVEEGLDRCNGIDDDCDGTADEGCLCTNDDTRPCGPETDFGRCVYGTQVCSLGSWGGCDGAVMSLDAEECNGIDDDCDDETDEGLTPPAAGKTLGVCAGSGLEQICGGVAGWQEPSEADYLAAIGPTYQTTENLCDGLDNDCDGEMDIGCGCVKEDERPCGTDVGICESGIQICNEYGIWGLCQGSTEPGVETCNGLDDNCDGSKDEGFNCVRGETESCGSSVGECSSGQKTCNQACNWTACDDNGPASEQCNGLDDDCDNVADNNITDAPMMALTGICSGMSFPQTCVEGTWQDQELATLDIEGFEEEEESCDGLDNNCNGEVDENCTCVHGEVEDCGTDVGRCVFGSRECVAGEWGPCEGGTIPTAELCNGFDDDCDGPADEDIDESLMDPATHQLGECEGAKKICIDGIQIDPDYGAYSNNTYGPEICDGLDNDCDGVADNIERDCNTACEYGTQICVDGGWEVCSARQPDTNETKCDNIDDDCDGDTDEELTRSCDLGCENGIEICEAGSWVNCNARTPSPGEICDGVIDDDCDGAVDNGCLCTNESTQPCGPPELVGQCVPGEQVCVSGIWDLCGGATEASDEVCDGEDNDCNGVDDDNISPESMPLADLQEGVCEGVTQDCVNGEPVEPDYNQLLQNYEGPDEASCDGKDNDCDGTIDEDITRKCFSECGEGLQTCIVGETVGWNDDCTAVKPVVETCDGQDNDCDGTIDEGLTRDCSTACGHGTETCKVGGDGDWIECSAPEVNVEICNGEDDDCNGETDEVCDCVVGEEQPCGTNVGACLEGIQICYSDGWGECDGGISGGDEKCDGDDNDCNGTIDEGLTQDCSTACGDGVETCKVGGDGDWIGCTAPKPTVETCNNVDDDCDGKVDEYLVKTCTTACGRGTTVCSAGKWGLCSSGLPTVESCDGEDNDCDGEIDENVTIACSTACGTGIKECLFGGSRSDWGLCSARQPDSSETKCDGVDDDCNGLTDENLIDGCTAVCGNETLTGYKVCSGGSWGACSVSANPTTEVCDGEDNDCDGYVDEGNVCPECTNGQIQSCTANAEGECAYGQRICVGGQWPDYCTPGQPNSVDICDNNKDDDCDGQVNEGCTQQECDDWERRDCLVPYVAGICRIGSQTCLNGSWPSSCDQVVFPIEESGMYCYDGLDNNCNGFVDECTPGTVDPGGVVTGDGYVDPGGF